MKYWEKNKMKFKELENELQRLKKNWNISRALYQRLIDCYKQQLAKNQKLIDSYKQEIDDKEKNIKQLKLDIDAENRANTFRVWDLQEKEQQINILEEHKFFADKIIDAYADKCKKHDQDKISFAVEQLEKLKKFVIRQLFITIKGCSDLDKAEAKGCNELREETIKEIDNQIKQLRKKQDE